MRKNNVRLTKGTGSTRVRTRPCSTVARSRSNHLCKAVSRSLTEPVKATSEGPHKMNSKTDFDFERDSDLSCSKMSAKMGVILVLGNISVKATWAHLHKVPMGSSSSLLLLKKEKNSFTYPCNTHKRAWASLLSYSLESTTFDRLKGISSTALTCKFFMPFINCNIMKATSRVMTSSKAGIPFELLTASPSPV
ncbi:hypothetical protein FF38_08993 [Lucilia cuprina]|uniref:Uncharacterized protein n=1 Tax=Lucilia cuprina TaxID=7375 RepID=A0A0L0CND9_LUCCU|nr:hypothetical protein FF38_08993 [Lucilia cuprina]